MNNEFIDHVKKKDDGTWYLPTMPAKDNRRGKTICWINADISIWRYIGIGTEFE